MNYKQQVVKEIRDTTTIAIQNIIKYLPITVPADDVDKKAFAIGTDMLECMVKDINGMGISEVLDMDRLVRDWSEVRESLDKLDDAGYIHKTIDTIADAYMNSEGDE